MQHICQRRGVDIDPAHNEHIVHASQHAAWQEQKTSSACALIAAVTHKVTCPVTQCRTYPASQGCEDQFSYLALLHRLACLRIENFSEKFPFVHMDPLLLGAGETIGTHLRHACMVKGPCSPCAFDAFA